MTHLSTLAMDSEDRASLLRARIISSIADQGIVCTGDNETRPPNGDKDVLRRMHSIAVSHAIAKARPGLERKEGNLLRRIASGSEVDLHNFRPRLVEVRAGTEDELLFRYAKLHWSVPVSAGYGRRLRFLVIDDNNSKLVGLIGLGDPVYSLSARDSWIGWEPEAKRKTIGSIMDAFVLGAVPPYSMLLGSKLVALIACSREVSDAFRTKYGKKQSLISGRQPELGLALITTSSALGRSSVYNRLRIRENHVFRSVGFTKGSGEFHFANDLYQEILAFVRENSQPSAKNAAWGTGFRSKREVVLKALSILGLPQDLIYHGVRREVFVAPLASNARECLQGDELTLLPNTLSVKEVADYFQSRWLLPRAEWDHRYQGFSVKSYGLWNQQ